MKNFAKASPPPHGRVEQGFQDLGRHHGPATTSARNEQSVILEAEDTLSIVHVAADGTETVLEAVDPRCSPVKSSTPP